MCVHVKSCKTRLMRSRSSSKVRVPKLPMEWFTQGSTQPQVPPKLTQRAVGWWRIILHELGERNH